MQFQKTVVLTNEVLQKLHAKQLNFQRGQLVQLDDGKTKGRFIKRSAQMIHVVWSGDTNNKGFKHHCNLIKAKKAGRQAH